MAGKTRVEVVDVGGVLSGLRWNIPCKPGGGSDWCGAEDPIMVATTLRGTPGASYDVTLRFRGVVEQKTYVGGTNDGANWQVGGAPPSGDPYNVYRLGISSPAQTYYLNRGVSGTAHCWVIDYTKTLRVATGATVRLTAETLDKAEITNRDENGSPLVVAGIPPAPNPYSGQFIQMDVVKVSPAP